MRRLFLSGLLLTISALPAAAAPTTDVPASAAAAEDFAPPGWTLERQAAGDLNRDGRPDLAMIFLDPDPAHLQPQGRDAFEMLGAGNPRILAIAFARPGGGYRLAVAEAAFLPRRRSPNGLSEGYMLFGDGSLEIDRGRLRIYFEYTRAHTSFLLRWQEGAFRLIGYDSAGVAGGCLHQLSVNYLSRRAKLKAAWTDRDEDLVRWSKLPAAPLPTLAEIGEGEAHDPFGLLSGFPLTCPER